MKSESPPVASNPLPYSPVEDADISKLTNRLTNGLTYDAAGKVMEERPT